MEKGKYSGKMLIGSILAGMLYAVIGEVIYRILKDRVLDLIVVTIYLMGLFFFVGFSIWVLGKFVYHRSFKRISVKQWIGITLAMLVLTVGFEYLYEMQLKGRTRQVDAYVFVIDNSGSMDSSDPDGLRFQAIEKILAEKPSRFLYAIYTFSDSANLVRELGDQTGNTEYDHGSNEGLTAIYRTLEKILSDIEDGILDLTNRNCHIIFLSDGNATDVTSLAAYREGSVLDEFVQKGISISTVGLLDADRELMSLIAEKTGGIFVNVDDISNLENAMTKASQVEKKSRNLLDYREKVDADRMYAIMRVIVLAVLGGWIGLQKAVICEKFIDTMPVIKSSVVGSILAGIWMEAGLNGLGINSAIVRGLGCVLISFTLLREDVLRRNTADAEVYKGYGKGEKR